jgi:hypothetical protein
MRRAPEEWRNSRTEDGENVDAHHPRDNRGEKLLPVASREHDCNQKPAQTGSWPYVRNVEIHDFIHGVRGAPAELDERLADVHSLLEWIEMKGVLVVEAGAYDQWLILVQ